MQYPNMETTPTHAPNPPSGLSPVRRRFWQFSLMNMLLVAVIFGFGIAHFTLSQKLFDTQRQLREEQIKQDSQQWQINRLQAELGVITVTEPTKVHLLLLNTGDTHHWKWRVYWPPANSSCSLNLAVGKIPAKGFDVKPVGTCTFGISGQMTVEAFMRRYSEGKHVFVVQVPGRELKINYKLTDEQADDLSHGTSVHLAGVGTTEVVSQPGPIELLRDRIPQPDPNRPGSSIYDGGEPSFGVLLWLK